MQLLFLDTETTGLDPVENQVLTLGLTMWKDRKIVKEPLEIAIKHDNYVISDYALEVNKINIEEHDKIAIPLSEAILKVKAYAGYRPYIAGHNVTFDIGFLKELFGKAYSRLFDYKYVCTMQMLVFLKSLGMYDIDSMKLTDACAYFDIDLSNAHNAAADAEASALLYNVIIGKLVGEKP